MNLESMEMFRYGDFILVQTVLKTHALLLKLTMQCLLYTFCITYCRYQLFLPVVIYAFSYGFSKIFAGMPHKI
jgi:hypothetical protein